MSDNPVDILLVEDNPADAELTLHVLRKNNLANCIKLVRDGQEALAFLFNAVAEPKFILLDLKLPKVDGLEVLAKIKSDPRTRRIPVVILTSSREERDLARCYDLGVNSYIVKPVDFAQFTTSIRQLGLYWLLLNRQQSSNTR